MQILKNKALSIPLKLIIGILVGVIPAVISMYSDKYIYFFVLVLFAMLAILFSFTIYQPIKVISFLLFLCIGFNIELKLFDTGYIGGLPPAITLNQFILFTLILMVLRLNFNKKNIKDLTFKTILLHDLEYRFFILFMITGALSFINVENKIAFFYVFIRLIILLFLFILLSKFSISFLWFQLSIAFAIISIFQLILGIIQLKIGDSIGLFFLGENINPFRAGVDLGERGISGTLGHPGTFGLFYLLISPIFLSSFLNYKNFKINHKKTSKIILILFIFATLSSFLAVMLTNARTSIVIFIASFLGVLMGSFFIKIKYNSKNAIYIVQLTVIFLIMIPVLSYSILLVSNRFINSDFSHQLDYRGMLSKFALDLIFSSEKNMFFGVGLNNYVEVLSRYGNDFAHTNPVHNFYLLLWAEGGLIHLITYIALTCTVFVKMMIVFLKGNKEIAYMALGILASLVSLLIYNFTGWAPYHNQNFYVFSILCITSLMVYRKYKQ